MFFPWSALFFPLEANVLDIARTLFFTHGLTPSISGYTLALVRECLGIYVSYIYHVHAKLVLKFSHVHLFLLLYCIQVYEYICLCIWALEINLS